MPATNQEMKAIGSGLAVTAVLGVIGVGVLLSMSGAGDERGNGRPDDAAEGAANLGSSYIQTLAAYDAKNNPPIVLEAINQIAGHWEGVYRVEPAGEERTLLYRFRLDIADGRVTGYVLESSDTNQEITLFEPEPQSVVADSQLMVKGVLKEAGALSVQLLSEQGALLASVRLDAPRMTFSHSFDLSGIRGGSVVLSLRSEKAELEVPLVIAQKQL